MADEPLCVSAISASVIACSALRVFEDFNLSGLLPRAEVTTFVIVKLTYKEHNTWKPLQGISLAISCFVAHRKNSQHLLSGAITSLGYWNCETCHTFCTLIIHRIWPPWPR